MQSAGSNSLARPTYFFIASEVRSGSTYVAELIAYSLNAVFGYELWDLTREHFQNFNDDSSAADVERSVRSLWLNPHRMRSSKVMCAQLSIMNRWARRNSDLRQLVFGEDAKWIVVRRRDKIRQAVSLAFARQSGIFHNYDPSRSNDSVSVTMKHVEDALRAVILSDEYLRIFSPVPQTCAEIFYEDVLQDPKGCITDALTAVGLLPRGTDIQVGEVKIAPDRQSQKAALYDAFAEWLLENHHQVPDVEQICHDGLRSVQA